MRSPLLLIPALLSLQLVSSTSTAIQSHLDAEPAPLSNPITPRSPLPIREAQKNQDIHTSAKRFAFSPEAGATILQRVGQIYKASSLAAQQKADKHLQNSARGLTALVFDHSRFLFRQAAVPPETKLQGFKRLMTPLWTKANYEVAEGHLRDFRNVVESSPVVMARLREHLPAAVKEASVRGAEIRRAKREGEGRVGGGGSPRGEVGEGQGDRVASESVLKQGGGRGDTPRSKAQSKIVSDGQGVAQKKAQGLKVGAGQRGGRGRGDRRGQGGRCIGGRGDAKTDAKKTPVRGGARGNVGAGSKKGRQSPQVRRPWRP